MKFTGQIRIPEVDHPGIPATILVEDAQVEILLDGESLGRWSLYDVHARRLVSAAFQLELDSEEVTFIADEPIDFAYRGVDHMAETWARMKAMRAIPRSLAVKRSRNGVKPSRIGELRAAMEANLAAEQRPAPRPAALAEPPAPEVTPSPEPAAPEPPGPDAAEILAEERARLEEERHRLAEERARLEELRREAEERDARRIEAFRLEMARLEAERVEHERIEAERSRRFQEEMERLREERERLQALEAEVNTKAGEDAAREQAVRQELERLETARREMEQAEAERVAAAEREMAEVEARRQELARLESETAEALREVQEEVPEEEPPLDEVFAPEPADDDGVVVDLDQLDGAPEPALAGATSSRSGLMGAVRSAFTRGSRNHAHDFVLAPGGLGITRSICRDCGYVSISTDE